MASVTVEPRDERPHQPPDDGDGAAPDVPWSDSWVFDFAAADGTLGGWVRITRFPELGRSWYEAVVAGPRQQLLTVVDHDVPFRSSALEVRTTGLWADHVCETPLDHWTVGLEAFALGVDDPRDLDGPPGQDHADVRGDRVPLGFDLEWEADGPAVEPPGGTGPGVVGGFVQASRVHGELLLGDAEIDLHAVGARHRRWGRLDWWGEGGWRATGTHDGGRTWAAEGRGGVVDVVVVGADGRATATAGTGDADLDADGLPTGFGFAAEDLVVRAEVLAPAPVVLGPVAGEVLGSGAAATVRRGGRTRRPTALCRVRTGDGGIGVGWLEVRRAVAALPPG